MVVSTKPPSFRERVSTYFRFAHGNDEEAGLFDHITLGVFVAFEYLVMAAIMGVELLLLHALAAENGALEQLRAAASHLTHRPPPREHPEVLPVIRLAGLLCYGVAGVLMAAWLSTALVYEGVKRLETVSLTLLKLPRWIGSGALVLIATPVIEGLRSLPMRSIPTQASVAHVSPSSSTQSLLPASPVEHYPSAIASGSSATNKATVAPK